MLARLHGGGEKNIDPGFKVMKENVGPNILAYEPSPAKHAEWLQTGQAIFGVWGSARVQPLAESGVAVAFVYPKEGSPVVMVAICPVAKKTVSPKAHAFVRMMLEPAAQKIMAEDACLALVNSMTQLSKVGHSVRLRQTRSRHSRHSAPFDHRVKPAGRLPGAEWLRARGRMQSIMGRACFDVSEPTSRS